MAEQDTTTPKDAATQGAATLDDTARAKSGAADRTLNQKEIDGLLKTGLAPQDEAAAQWAAMLEENVPAKSGGADRALNQEDIDGFLGFSLADLAHADHSGIRAIIDSAMVSYERLPMLEIVFDRLVRLMTTSLRNFTSDNVEV